MQAIFRTVFRLDTFMGKSFKFLQDVALFAARAYVAWVFFKAGSTKLRDWDTTLFLFEEEYSVPLLSPTLAAYLGTLGELVFPVLLMVGFFSRLSAIGLSIVNLVAVLSLAFIPPAAMLYHILWGILLLMVVLWSGGRLSVDFVIRRKYL